MWQPAPVIFPDAELLLATGMRAVLIGAGETGVHVGNKIPQPRTGRMVNFNRDGGDDTGLIDRPRMRCRVWGTSDQNAIDLARKVASLMPLLVDGQPITYTAKLSGPYVVPDESEQAQVYLLFEVHTRGQQV